MASVSEILQTEHSKAQNTIVLFDEGLFYKAYEQSAYALVNEYGFKPSKKFVKLVGQSIVSVGFPKSALDKYAPNATKVNEKTLLVSFGCDINGFEEWKNTIEVAGRDVQVSASIPMEYEDIVREIRAFSIETASPLECMLFISEIKKKINACQVR